LIDQSGEEGYVFYIVDNNAVPIYPVQFGITNDKIRLMSSISNFQNNNQNYLLEIDTNKMFANPIENTIISQNGGLLQWEPQFTPIHNTVYYWRVSPDSTDQNIGYIWNTSSFLYHEDYADGWNQSHYDQFKQDQFENLKINHQNQFDYATNFIGYQVINRLRSIGAFPSYYKEQELMDYSNGYDITSGVYIAVFDTVNVEPWINPKGGLYGSDTPENWIDRKVFPFITDTQADRIELMDFINLHIPTGYNVLFMNIQSEEHPSNANEWGEDTADLGKSIFTILADQGAQKAHMLESQANLPYIFAFRKDKQVIEELIGENETAKIEKTIYFPGKWYEGKMSSAFIGPALSWTSLLWDEDKMSMDISDLELQLYDTNQHLIETRTIDQSSETSLTDIDASLYPFLKLNYTTKDTVDRTSPQLIQWRIVYENLPELVMNPSNHFLFHADTLHQGEMLQFEMAVTNASQTRMDSTWINYSIIDDKNQEQVSSLLECVDL